MSRSSSITHGPSTTYVILIAGAAALGGFLFGFDTAVINGAVAALTTTFNATSWQTGLAVSLALLGSAVGAFYAGQIADRYGRIKAMVVAAGLFAISSVGSGIAVGLWDFTFWRILGGVAIGTWVEVAVSCRLFGSAWACLFSSSSLALT